MSEWQPIGSAPKDGSDFLCFAEGGVVIACWWGDQWSSHQFGDQVKFDATHWMPLPEAPDGRG